MDFGTIQTFISVVGFPIFACCMMFVQNNKLQDTLKDISVTMQKMADGIQDLESKEGEE
jgi:hypothetical protein